MRLFNVFTLHPLSPLLFPQKQTRLVPETMYALLPMLQTEENLQGTGG
jgi:hypothetical protein